MDSLFRFTSHGLTDAGKELLREHYEFLTESLKSYGNHSGFKG